MKYLMILPLMLMIQSCVTPLHPRKIAELTTCKNTTLEKIRKNLLLAGYEIKDQGKEDITTGWKQVSGYDKHKTLRRITVVKVDDKTFKFRIRNRYVSVEKENQMTITNSKKNRKGGLSSSQTIGFGSDVERASDSNQSYYEEHVADYEDTQREVCG